MKSKNDTIVALASGRGGAIALIRVSGNDSITVGDKIFHGVHGKTLADTKSFTIRYGTICDGERTIDEVLISVFRAPHSYTGENMIEISCHASPYICQEILRLLSQSGARAATAGEFTLRAFLAGKVDLSQAEAVADVIAADNRAAHTLAFQQMRGGYSDEFKILRERLIELVSLIELELDFSEEEVEFADRKQLYELIDVIEHRLKKLIDSFRYGNVLKTGIPVAIVGVPNVGKSTLLNALLQEDKALVSDIAGTTRDVIEDTLTLHGINFRFIDTAGIRQTEDPLEHMGIERTFDRIGKASIILLMTDAQESAEEIYAQYCAVPCRDDQRLALLLNKCDRISAQELTQKRAALSSQIPHHPILTLSAKQQTGLDELIAFLCEGYDNEKLQEEVVVFNNRHHELLEQAHNALLRAKDGLESGISGDLLAQDLREVLHYIGMITGEITTDDILSSIFSKFCIGK